MKTKLVDSCNVGSLWSRIYMAFSRNFVLCMRRLSGYTLLERYRGKSSSHKQTTWRFLSSIGSFYKKIFLIQFLIIQLYYQLWSFETLRLQDREILDLYKAVLDNFMHAWIQLDFCRHFALNGTKCHLRCAQSNNISLRRFTRKIFFDWKEQRLVASKQTPAYQYLSY